MTKVIESYGGGIFFPSDSDVLRTQIARHLRDARHPECRPKGIIVPHAGYDYSGPIAAAGYACLAGQSSTIRRVVLLGTCHMVRTEALLTTTADAFVTPLGMVKVDTAAVRQAAHLPQVSFDDEVHAADHALAVQLPMLQTTLEEFQVVPMLVGECPALAVAELLELLWGGTETLVVVSSDLSHNLSYDEARRRDSQTARAIVRLDADAIGRGQACGYRAVGGLLIAARRHNLRARQVDLRNSGDTTGCLDRVVGYAAFVFESEHDDDQ
jgi:AmmeMemoRadiSam system protein B